MRSAAARSSSAADASPTQLCSLSSPLFSAAARWRSASRSSPQRVARRDGSSVLLSEFRSAHAECSTCIAACAASGRTASSCARRALGRRRPPALDGAQLSTARAAPTSASVGERHERAEQRRRARRPRSRAVERADELAGEAEILPRLRPTARRRGCAQRATSSAYARSESIVPEPRRRREPSVCISSRKCSSRSRPSRRPRGRRAPSAAPRR